MEPLVFERVAPPISPSPAGAGALVPFPVLTKTAPRHNVAALFEAEESGLLRFALSLVRQRAVAEDLVQETFLRFHQIADEVENPRGWLYRSLRNLALNHLRDHRKDAELHEETTAHDKPLPAEDLEHGEAVGMMRLLIAELPPEDRELVGMKYLDGLKYQEIARRTGLSVGNVGYRLHHVLKGLADSLRRAGIHGSEG